MRLNLNLTNFQKRKNNSAVSSWTSVSSGVPQGSVLGPLLFIIYINDFPGMLKSTCKLFADDTKLYGQVSDDKGKAILQKDLDACSKWAKDWLMEFHPKKCKVIHFGKKNDRHGYTLDGHPIQDVSEEKDLGVHISEDIKWALHISEAVKNANRMIGMIKHTFTYMNKKMFLTLYKSLVRPHLEYCPQVWNPTLKKDIDELEKVQRRATKLVPELYDIPYEERLKILNLYPLHDRRLRGDMILTFKLLKGLLDIDAEKIVPLHQHKSNTRSNNMQLKCTVTKTSQRQSFFSQRVVRPWNSLSNDIIGSNTVNTFKGRYDKEKLGIYAKS